MKEIVDALDDCPFTAAKPSMIIAHTIKGKGLAITENETKWYWGTLGEEDYKVAIKQLEM